MDQAVGLEGRLAHQLDQVGEGLDDPERAGAVGAEATLEAAQHLALDQRHEGEGEQQDDEDRRRPRWRRSTRPRLVASGSTGAHGFAHLYARRQLGAVLRGDPDRTRHKRGVDARAQLDRGSVRAHDHLVAVCDRAPVGVLGRDLDLGGRALEGELGHVLDHGIGEERSVADQLERAAAGRRLGLRLGGRERPLPRRAAGSAERSPSEESATSPSAFAASSVKARRRGGHGTRDARPTPRKRTSPSSLARARRRPLPRRARYAEALAQLRQPGQLGADGRGAGAAQTLQAALEIAHRPLSLEVAGRRQHQVGPGGRVAGEKRQRHRRAGALAASSRTSGRSPPRRPRRLGGRSARAGVRRRSSAAAQASATPRGFGVAGR